MAKVAGTCFLKVNGTQFSLKGNMKIALGGFEREPVVGLDQYHGIMEKPVAASIEGDITDMAGLDIKVLENLDNVTVTVELINGKVAILRNATQTNKLELNAEDGSIPVKFQGPEGEWLSA
jgi:hypothetical protein